MSHYVSSVSPPKPFKLAKPFSPCSSLTEALEVVNEMKVAGINAASEGIILSKSLGCTR